MKRILAVLFVLLLVSMVPSALAHEGREVGDYELHFGWQVEPAFSYQLNGPEVYISLHSDTESEEAEEAPFPEDIEVSLQVDVTFGPETITLTMEPVFGETGHYAADLIPTLPGDYSFRLYGTVGDTAVDEVFTSADGQFSSIEPSTDVMFPQAGAIDIAELLARIEALEARIAELEGN